MEKEKCNAPIIVMMQKTMKEELTKKASQKGIGQISNYVRNLIEKDLK